LLSYVGTATICALQFIPGPHQGPSIVLGQTLVIFSKNIN